MLHGGMSSEDAMVVGRECTGENMVILSGKNLCSIAKIEF